MRFIALLALVLIALGNGTRAEDTLSNGTERFGYDLVLAKMDYLQQRLLELQVENKQLGEMLHQLLEQNREILEQQKICSNQDKGSEQNSDVEQQQQNTPATTASDDDTIVSCSEEKANSSGRYKLTVSNKTIEVYCEQQLYGAGWILIQNRSDGSVSFDRNWTEYRNGFGNMEGEFWLGLENIHLLTSSKQHKLLVHLEDYQGIVKHITYDNFSIGNECGRYVLQISKHFQGSLKDSLADYHGGSKFSTPDQDNDSSEAHCAQFHRSGWWFRSCYSSNLNGLHRTDESGMEWSHFHDHISHVKISKMMIRAK